jgi:hypothetical protein
MVASASSSKWALADKEATTVNILGIDIDGVWLRWPATVSKEAEVRVER